MDLLSGSPYWPKKNKATLRFPTLSEDISTEIAIIGGGITGALVALAFHDAGHNIVVIDKRKIAHGSTSASTALLQYEIDLHLSELIPKIGKKEAQRVYHLCGDSIADLEKISRRFPCDFVAQPSLYFANNEDDLPDLKKEFSARKEAGFAVTWLEKNSLQEKYGVDSPGAILSELGGSIDPYLLTYRIFEYLQTQGVSIFEESPVVKIETKGSVILRTKSHAKITAAHLIMATGYETQRYLQEKIVTLKSTYCLITKPLKKKAWSDNALLWNTASPYLYARHTTDNRVILGGGDLPFRTAWLRDLLLYIQAKRVQHQFESFLPGVKFSVDSRWCGTFGETKDGLAYIGSSPEWKNTSFALGFGGNGITYSVLAAQLLLKQYHGEKVPDLELFRFGR